MAQPWSEVGPTWSNWRATPVAPSPATKTTWDTDPTKVGKVCLLLPSTQSSPELQDQQYPEGSCQGSCRTTAEQVPCVQDFIFKPQKGQSALHLLSLSPPLRTVNCVTGPAVSNGVYLGGISDTRRSEDDLACCAVEHEGSISEEPICKSGSLCQPPHSSVSQQNYRQDGNVQDNVCMRCPYTYILLHSGKHICSISNCFVTITRSGSTYLRWKWSGDLESDLKPSSQRHNVRRISEVFLWITRVEILDEHFSPAKTSLSTKEERFYTCIQTQTTEHWPEWTDTLPVLFPHYKRPRKLLFIHFYTQIGNVVLSVSSLPKVSLFQTE